MQAEVTIKMALEDMDRLRSMIRTAHGHAVLHGMDGESFKSPDARADIAQVEYVASKLNIGLPAWFVRGRQ